ncbi:MAG: SpoIIIAH-like family protein [Clostridia bacterium]
MKILKKNQIVIYVIAIMLMTAGYLNYSTNDSNNSVETSMNIESKDDSKLADIGDATLVNSNDVVESNTQAQETTAEAENNTTDNENTKENETQTNEAETSTDSVKNSKDDYFSKSKLERETMYSQMLETYEKVLNSTNAEEVQKQSATTEIKKINDTKNSIMICENLIQTKGFEDCVIFVNGDSVSIIVKKDELAKEDVAQIQNIISREMNSQIENIHIANK